MMSVGYRSLLAAGCLAAAFAASVACAAEVKDFEKASFDAARKAGKPVVVDISATWCPTCAAQKPIVDALSKEPAYADLILFHVDFDAQKDVVRALGAQMQSTLIAFDGDKETGRSVGDTKPVSIGALFASTIGD
ncbi:thioredoxin family protein [Rhizobium sp. PL01]|uniref:thioredoxin family protein n=1 Tax=Rhizobium sp. PL01 TaxID=3085631 RepID=UPI0029825AC1|nr:thioredoxin family protein [Rhizobium sp. PL01]MDW5318512.1 thioredoxin family protein [Rhizobium sp. PL01]